jgi:hypothetical protein
MPIKRINKGQKQKAFRSNRTKTSDFDVALADEISEPSGHIGDYVLWLHGAPGVGKTTFCAQFEDIHMFMPEVRGAKAVASYQKPITHWMQWQAYHPVLKKDKKFRTLSIDVLEKLYDLCFEYMCKEVMHIDHPQDEKDFGKSWGKITKEFVTSIGRLSELDKGLILVSHSVEKPITTFTGETYDLIRPNLSGTALQMLHGAVDIIGYMYAEGDERFMRIRDNGDVMAKCRPTSNFFWPDGEQIEVIPLGKSARQAYKNFVLAFNNKLARPERKVKKRKVRK